MSQPQHVPWSLYVAHTLCTSCSLLGFLHLETPLVSSWSSCSLSGSYNGDPVDPQAQQGVDTDESIAWALVLSDGQFKMGRCYHSLISHEQYVVLQAP